MEDNKRYAFWYSPKQAKLKAGMRTQFCMPHSPLGGLKINGKVYSECRQLNKGKPNWPDAKYVGMGTINEVSVNGVQQ